MEEKLKNNLLLDFYGNMLTEKQRQIMSLYIEEDTSLSEIAAELNTSRQAIYDAVKSSEKLLLSFEEKLKCVERFLNNREKLLEVITEINDIEETEKNNKNIEKLQNVKLKLEKVLQNQ